MAWDGIRHAYDTVAATYEARFLDELDRKPRDRELLAAFADDVDDPVLDLGCGPGQIGFAVGRHGRRVIGADLSLPMARLAATRLAAAVVADMRALPFADASLGGVVAFYSLIHVRRPDLQPALHELARVLRPGGLLLVSAHEGEGEIAKDDFLDLPVPVVATLLGLDELTGAAQAAGLEVEVAERRVPYADEATVRLYVQARRPVRP